MKSGIYSVLPWMTMAVTSNVGGWIADKMVTRGVSVTTVRKVMQSVRPLLEKTYFFFIIWQHDELTCCTVFPLRSSCPQPASPLRLSTRAA